jgi:hypothetical protein
MKTKDLFLLNDHNLHYNQSKLQDNDSDNNMDDKKYYQYNSIRHMKEQYCDKNKET